MCISDRTKALQEIFRGLGIDRCICDEAEAVNTLGYISYCAIVISFKMSYNLFRKLANSFPTVVDEELAVRN